MNTRTSKIRFVNTSTGKMFVNTGTGTGKMFVNTSTSKMAEGTTV